MMRSVENRSFQTYMTIDQFCLGVPADLEVESRQVLVVNQNLKDDFCTISMDQVSRKGMLTYDIVSTIPLIKWLQMEKTTGQEVKQMLRQLVDACDHLEVAGLDLNGLLLELSAMFWDISSNQLKLIYLPFKTKDNFTACLRRCLVQLFGEVWMPQRKADLQFTQQMMTAYKKPDFTLDIFKVLVKQACIEKKSLFSFLKSRPKKQEEPTASVPISVPMPTASSYEVRTKSRVECAETQFLIQPDTHLAFEQKKTRQPLLKVKIVMANMTLEEYVDEFPCIIGRAHEAHLQIEDIKVSRQHGEIAWQKEGFTMVDMGSSNGTKVNGEKLQIGEKRPLQIGDIIQVGASEIKILGADY